MRDRLEAFGLALAVALIVFVAVAAAQGPPPEPFSVNLIKDGVYWTRGGAGGNTGFVVGKDGVIVFDAKMTPDSAKEMLAAIAKITPKPVTHVILSHSDADHVNGFAEARPARLSSNQNVRQGTRPHHRRRARPIAPLGAGTHQRRPGHDSPRRKNRARRRSC